MKATLIALLAVIGLSACTTAEKAYVCEELNGTKHTLVIVGSQFIYDGIAYQIEEYQPMKGFWHFIQDDRVNPNTYTSIYFNKKTFEVDIEVRGKPYVSKSHHISWCR